jgi:CheY-like chemotaxis protein
MLDLTMPLKDGFAVARAARELRLAVPLVFLTMRNDKHHRNNIATKLDLRGSHALVKFAVEHQAEL